jgi:miniconductance mechanosensitive channel
MLSTIKEIFLFFNFNKLTSSYLAEIAFIILILISALIINYALKAYIVRFIAKLSIKTKSDFFQYIVDHNLYRRLSHLGPGIFIYFLTNNLSPDSIKLLSFFKLINTISSQYILFTFLWFLFGLINTTHEFYLRLIISKRYSIRGYIQLVKILLSILAIILSISIILDKSPLFLLTGLGAISAVLMLIFKDSILGLIASIQVTLYDMVRVGDWVVLPSMGADGDVLEVNINTVKIQNFDKTIVTVPTYSLISSSMQNWRGMKESGGRRIKRSIKIDMDTIKFCDEELLVKLKKIKFLKEHIEKKENDILLYNKQFGSDEAYSGERRQTNIGLFRSYVEHYLRSRTDIHLKYTFLVRHLEPTENGLPIQLYIFTNTTNWVEYEGIQADIFDHLLAILHVFQLKPFQNNIDLKIQR